MRHGLALYVDVDGHELDVADDGVPAVVARVPAGVYPLNNDRDGNDAPARSGGLMRIFWQAVADFLRHLFHHRHRHHHHHHKHALRRITVVLAVKGSTPC